MNTTIEVLLENIIALSPEKRSFLAEKILESLDAEPGTGMSEQWLDEINKRCEEIDNGSVEMKSAEEVFEAAYSRIL